MVSVRSATVSVCGERLHIWLSFLFCHDSCPIMYLQLRGAIIFTLFCYSATSHFLTTVCKLRSVPLQVFSPTTMTSTMAAAAAAEAGAAMEWEEEWEAAWEEEWVEEWEEEWVEEWAVTWEEG